MRLMPLDPCKLVKINWWGLGKRVRLKEESTEGHLPSIPFSQPSGLVDLPNMDLDFSTANSR
ncbi:MAG: hypothetical protein K0R12_499 [Gammaproteobacteria bacterium]|jgi:hypothetical protein|nr:hypothetical protein [Gammaproteobacteria bacterium]